MVVADDDAQKAADPTIHVSDDAVAQIALTAAQAVDGVTVLMTGHGLGDLLSRRTVGRGVRVEVDGDQATVELTLSVRYGERIPELAHKVQEEVRDALEHMTGLSVRAVHIHVAQVSSPSSHSGPPAAPAEESGR